MKAMGTATDEALPAYARPPVVEVVLAVQFESFIGYRSLDLGKIARHWERKKFTGEERMPLPSMVVTPGLPSVAWKISEEVETPRLWLMSEDKDRVIQLQQDRLVVNWQRSTTSTEYPSYKRIREFFIETWKDLEEVVKELELAMPAPSICEVIYNNHIHAETGSNSIDDVSAFIAPWSGETSDNFLPSARQAGLSLRYELPDECGWLTIEGQTMTTSNNQDQLTLSLASRGSVVSSDFGGVLEFMDLAHEWIVRGFTSVTTREAHKQWERYDVT